MGAATSPLILTGVLGLCAGWRWAYLAVLLIQAVLAVLFAASARRWSQAATQPTGAGPGDPSSSSQPRRRRRSEPRAIAGLGLVAVECGLESVVGLWAFVFLYEAVGLEPAWAGGVVSGYWAALVIGRVLLGSVAARVGTWPVLAAASVLVTASAALVMSRHSAATALGVVLLGLAVAPIYPLLVLTTAERTTACSADTLVGFQAAASTLGAVSCSGLVGLVMGADLSGFASCVLALAVLTTGGLWVLRPGHLARAHPAQRP